MTKKLGINSRTNSIGWALVENNTILAMGSRIFPEGVVNLGDGEGREASKNASRGEIRGKRRQNFRRKIRKRILLKALTDNGLCPVDASLVPHCKAPDFFKHPAITAWFKLNPYSIRARAIQEKISLFELGRIFYHMIQHRGFLSNSRSAAADVKETSVLYKGEATSGKIGIEETRDLIAKNKTLGNYLYSIFPEENKPFAGEIKRIRNRYTTRQMYVNEFEVIWEFQKKFHPELTETLKASIGGRKKDKYPKDGILFHQRPLRSQKHLVGHCPFEPKKTKCPLSAIPFELFRIYQWVNTISFDFNGEKQTLTPQEREKIVALLLSKEQPLFKEIRKAIGKLDLAYQFNYKNTDRILGSYTISHLSHKKFFGPQWFDFSTKEQEDIWHVLYFFDNRKKLQTYASTHWGFNEEQAALISKFNLKEGYASLSRKAIRSILPFLKQGYVYDVAVAFAGVKKVLGKDWEQHEQFLLDNLPEIVRSNLKDGHIEPLKTMLKNEFHCTAQQLEKLYHHSTVIERTAVLKKLPVDSKADQELQKIKNPLVVTALFETRKLVNEIIDTYGKPDKIKVELAHDLKASKKSRYETKRKQQFLEKENDRIKKELELLGQRINHTNILKYKLWEECNHTCPYTGKTISINQLFTGEIHIEYIFPWSRSLNDSFNNKTLCYATENNAKGNKTPYEYYSKQGDQKWEAIKLQALNCFKDKYPSYPNAYNKFKYFVQKKHDNGFINRQLNDTRYISKEIKNYLSKICNNVSVAPGQMIAILRYHWGLNGILNTESNAKIRNDHRHHAIDALVLACATRTHLQELTKRNRYQKNHELKDFPPPWTHFRQDAEKAVAKILVSHKKQNNLLTVRSHKTIKNGEMYTNTGIAARGQLHKESVFGRRKPPGVQEAFHIRKPLDSLTTEKQLDKIVDPSIRFLIHQRINHLGGFVNGKIPKETFFIIDENGIKQPQVFLPNRKNGLPVPVKKVRIRENIGGAAQLKKGVNQYVNPRNNHHVLIFKDLDGHLQEEVISFWIAVKRKRMGEPVVQLPKNGKEIVTTLQINDMFLLGLQEEEIDWNFPDSTFLKNNLYRVQKFTSRDYYFRKHYESTLDGKLGKSYQYIKGFGKGKTSWKNFTPIKVKINSIGEIEKIK